MGKFTGVKLELDLEPQSPMIHFQSRQNGATIRASEVKPKLDRFILKKLEEIKSLSVAELKTNPQYGSIFSNPEEHNALNYKMQISALERPVVVRLNGRGLNKAVAYRLYYANSDKSEEEETRAVLVKTRVTILCFHGTLRGLIEKYIEEFFIVFNFGAMQRKGFGSFVPIHRFKSKLTKLDEVEIARYLKQEVKIDHCYCIRIDDCQTLTNQNKNLYYKKLFDEIHSFYGIMKSGRNFKGYARSYIYQYMHKRGMDNEKAWMKQKQLAPAIAKSKNVKKTERRVENPKFVRALLGTGESITYSSRLDEKKVGTGRSYLVPSLKPEDKVQISVKSTKGLERVASPIYFKIIQNVIFITAYPVPDEVYGQQFDFSNGNKKDSICVPEKNEFDMKHFLESYVNYYNGALRENIQNFNGKYVEKVGEPDV